MKRTRKSILNRGIGTAVGGALVVTWIAVALNNDGIATAQVELNDGGVWVTNQSEGLVAHLNYPAMALDSWTRAETKTFDIRQTGDSVAVHNQEAGAVHAIDAALVTLGQPNPLGDATVFEMGSHTIAAYAPAEGDVWAADFSRQSGLVDESNLVLSDVPEGDMAVSRDGAVIAASAESRQWHFGAEQIAFPEEIADGANVEVSAVGARGILLDEDDQKLYIESGPTVDLEGEDLRLQTPGPDADYALIASSTDLIHISLDDGEAAYLPASGKADQEISGSPTEPVMHQGCAHAAWSGSGQYLRECADPAQSAVNHHEGLASSEGATFRVNRDVIVLNDTRSGMVWLPMKDMQLVDDWEKVTTDDPDMEESEEKSNTLTDEPADPLEDTENQAPIAEDDSFGARPGQATLLPVLLNDSDEDGDILTVKALDEPKAGVLTTVRKDGAFQITLPESATGSVTFHYEVADGRGGTDEAKVTVSARPDSANDAPKQAIKTRIKLAKKGTVNLDVLGDWVDPDGDPIYLADAQTVDGLDVTYRQNGTLEITDISATPGLKQIPVVVSDGEESTEGVVTVDLVDASALPPMANADHISVTVGENAIVDPLANDTDPNGDSLRLVSIGTVPDGLSARANTSLGTVSLSAARVGTYYLTYSVSDGTAASTGRIRIDAVESQEDTLPVAENDLALLPKGDSVLVDVLANDLDPQGGVLTISEVDLPDDSPLVVAPVQHALLRVTAPRALTAPASFTYTVTNETGSATATVLVIPAAAISGAEPPELKPDRLVVRQGDVGTVAVLNNDRSPSNQTMTVRPTLDYQFDTSWGDPFVSDNLVRFRAGERTGEVKMVYTVTDTQGNVASETITVVVVPADETKNTPPTPKDVVVRTMAGRDVLVKIPLTGIDAEGDSVDLIGVGSSPKLGTVEKTADGSFIYSADKKSKGTDTFTYQVRDSYGATAEARIRVGIAPAAETNQNPVAQNDVITVRPGANVEVPVISNDVDPDGDPLELVPEQTTTQAESMTVAESGNLVVLTAPEKPGNYSVSYRVEDGRGGSARGLLTVNVTPDSPLLAPIARDDMPAVEGEPTSITVNVLENDSDPDGSVADLEVTSEDEGVTVNGGKLTIPTKPERQRILYTVTDEDGQSASAIVWVPAVIREAAPEEEFEEPRLLESAGVITVNAGETATVNINDYITPNVTITDSAKVQASVGWDGSPLAASATTIAFTASEDFSGRTSITLEVITDDGVTGTITLPVEVIGQTNRAPEFVPSSINVAAGEDPIVVNLSAMASDEDGDPLTFQLDSAPVGITADINGEQLTVTAPADALLGGIGSIAVTVSDGTESVSGSLPVTVSGSSKPLVQLSAISETVNLGESKTVNIAASAVNPFDEPLTLVGQPTVQTGTATVSAVGTDITVTPTAVGDVVVNYTVADATGRVERHVSSTITLSVLDVPDAPTNVTAAASGNDTVIVSWTPGATHGSPHTNFTVYDRTQGDSRQCGVQTQCTLSGRTLGKEHTFQVVATNAVGDSEPSASATVMLDVVPETPAAPAITSGDGWVRVTWDAPNSQGSVITGYEVYVNGTSVGTYGANTLDTGQIPVANGNEYVATVVAVNDAGRSAASPSSAGTIPFGTPSAPRNVAINWDANNWNGGDVTTLTVSWAAPSNNGGRAIDHYVVTGSDGSQSVIPGASTSATFQNVKAGAQQRSYRVVAVNVPQTASAADRQRGTSAAGSASAVIRGTPGAVTPGKLTATGDSGTVTIGKPTGGAQAGWTAGQLVYQYSTDGGQSWSTFGKGGSATLTGLTNGKTIQVYQRAVGSQASTGGQDVAGPSTAAGKVMPYGPPTAPKLSCGSGGAQHVICDITGGDWGGLTGYYDWSVSDKSASVTTSADGAQIMNMSPGNHEVCVTALQDRPAGAPKIKDPQVCTNLKVAKPQPDPTPEPTPDPTTDPTTDPQPADPPAPEPRTGTFSFSLGGPKECTYNCPEGVDYYQVLVTLQGWTPNGQVVCDNGGAASTTLTVDANGNLGPVELILTGYGANGGPGPAVAATVEAANQIWTCKLP